LVPGAARVEIDRQLAAAGWAVQDADKVNLAARAGISDGPEQAFIGAAGPARPRRARWTSSTQGVQEQIMEIPVKTKTSVWRIVGAKA
jgi:hypothetical protein